MKLKRILALLLMLAMLLSNLPVFGLADDAVTEPTQTTSVTEPTAAVTEPTVPVTEPSVPVTEPTAPVTEPTAPVTEPTVPATEPTVPATEPTVPATEPTVPVTEPTVPAETQPAPRTLFEQLMAAASAEEMDTILMLNVTERLDILTEEELYEVMDHLENLPYDDDYTEDVQFALMRMLQSVQGDSVCAVCGGVNGNHNEDIQLLQNVPSVGRTAEDELENVFFNKSLVRDESQKSLAIQIDAWTEGVASNTEIVLVVDQSGSMYQIAGENTAYSAANTGGYMSVSSFLTHNAAGNEKSEVPGYYVTINSSAGVSLIRWNPAAKNGAGQWEHSKLVYTDWGTAAFNTLEFNAQFSYINDPTKMQWRALSEWTSHQTTRTKIFKSLFGATIDAFYALVDQVKDLPNAKIGLVGFSTSPNGVNNLNTENTSGGTGVFSKINGTEVAFKHSKSVTEDELYATMIPADENALIKTAIRSLRSNYGGTCTQEGFNLANRLFEVSKQKNGYTSNEEVNRIVVLFTDGEPTVTVADTGNYNPKDAEKHAIAAAYTSKYTYGADVYAYANKNMEKNTPDSQIASKLFMDYVSSNYPEANYVNGALVNISDADKKADTYKGYASNAQDMINKFASLGASIFQENNALNPASQIRDTITPYFDIGGDYNGGHIIVQEIPCAGQDENGNATFDDSNATELYRWKSNEDASGVEGLKLKVNYDVTYTQDVLNASGQLVPVERIGDQVTVTGYDYGKSTVFKGQPKGYKLRLLIPIEPNEYFVGGNWAATNSPDSGMYPDDSTASTPVGGIGGLFKPPHTDVEIQDEITFDVEIDARAGSTYLETVTYDKLMDLVKINIATTGGKTVMLSLGEDNYGLTEDNEWILDNAYIRWELYDTKTDSEGNVLRDEKDNAIPLDTPLDPEGGNIDIRRDHVFHVKVWVWSKYTYDENNNELPQDPETSWQKYTPVTGEIDLFVYYPTFVFSDVTLYHGQPLELATEIWGEKMDATDYLYWYTNKEYEEKLVNPDAKPRSEEYPKGYTPLPPESIGKTEGDGVNTVVDSEVPHVFFKVDPIDQTVDNERKTEPVDTGFYQKFGDHMGKQPVALNVRVFFTNRNDPDYNPDNPPLENAMRNAFFLHTRNNTNTVPKHKSGSATSDDVYWGTEFFINPAYCELTIEKTGGIPGETYVFNISRGLPNEYSRHEDENGAFPMIQPEDKTLQYYTSVSVTTDSEGYGSVTIKELPVGVYQVEEDMEWSWRFQDKDSTTTVAWNYDDASAEKKYQQENKPFSTANVYLLGNAAQDSAVVTVTNSGPIEEWLSGMSAVVKNIFGVKKGS